MRIFKVGDHYFIRRWFKLYHWLENTETAIEIWYSPAPKSK
jgi:hypothetical protein